MNEYEGLNLLLPMGQEKLLKSFLYSCALSFMNGSEKPPNRIPYPLSIALVLCGCALVFSLISFTKGSPSSILGAVAKSGFTAAFSLIFVSEIGDKVHNLPNKGILLCYNSENVHLCSY